MNSPSATEAAFLDAIADEPDEDGPRLVYADWLMEQGDPRGELIRIQCELDGLAADAPGQHSLRTRSEQLKRQVLGWLGEPPPGVRVDFLRGLIVAVVGPSATSTVENVWWDRLRGRVFRLRLECDDETLVRWVRHGRLAGVPEVVVRGEGVTRVGLGVLDDLSRLRSLNLCGTRVTDRGLPSLAGLRLLRDLDLGLTRVTGSGLLNLAPLTRLERLSLNRSWANDDGLVFLPEFPRLRHLVLDGTRITDASVGRLARLGGLRQLDILGSRISPTGRRMLQRALPRCSVSPVIRTLGELVAMPHGPG